MYNKIPIHIVIKPF